MQNTFWARRIIQRDVTMLDAADNVLTGPVSTFVVAPGGVILCSCVFRSFVNITFPCVIHLRLLSFYIISVLFV